MTASLFKATDFGTRLLFSLRGHQSSVTSLCTFSVIPESSPGHSSTNAKKQNGNPPVYLISGDDQGTIILWDWEIRRPCRIWRAHGEGRGGVLHVQVLSVKDIGGCHKLFLFSQGRDDSIQVWDVNTLLSQDNQDPSPIRTLVTNSLHFCRFDTFIDQNGDLLFAMCSQRVSYAFDIYNYHSRKFVQEGIAADTGSKETGMVMCLNFLRHKQQSHRPEVSNVIAAAYENGSVLVWDWNSKTRLYSFKAHTEPVMSLSVGIQEGLPFLVSVAADDLVVKYQLDQQSSDKDATVTQQSVDTAISSSHLKIQGASDVCVDPTNHLILVGCWNGSVRLISLDSMDLLGQLVHHKKSIRRLVVLEPASPGLESTSEIVVVSASEDARISVWGITSKTITG